MDCPNCGASLRAAEGLESLRCDYCRSVHVPEPNDEGIRVVGNASELACPVCAVPLVEAAAGGERILYCTRCQGILVAMNAFVALTGELRARSGGTARVQPAADRKELERKITCPQCHQPMDAHFYEGPGNIVIDACSRCFLDWLDAGELTHVARAPDDSAAYA